MFREPNKSFDLQSGKLSWQRKMNHLKRYFPLSEDGDVSQYHILLHWATNLSICVICNSGMAASTWAIDTTSLLRMQWFSKPSSLCLELVPYGCACGNINNNLLPVTSAHYSESAPMYTAFRVLTIPTPLQINVIMLRHIPGRFHCSYLRGVP